MPDEIHIAIDLRERGSGNSKVTVDKQELDLKAAVKGLGIDATSLTLSDAMADLVPKKFRDDDVIARKGYMLKVADAEMVRKVFLELDRLQIEDARIHHVSHSKEVELRREQRIKAIKAAKEKADYLLEAIGEKDGPRDEGSRIPRY
ncbi:MAG: SIMPL domain-containing protein [Flavobacteriales bacterium]|nr:SIMPL domain-containing protein [Flavobacteriales bacterium]